MNHKIIIGRREMVERPGLFLDRDGVLIEEKNYLRDPREVELSIGVLGILERANSHGWCVVIITNQSGIGRGLFTVEEYEEVTRRMLDLIGERDLIDAIYCCGDHPDKQKSEWRKPGTGMIETAIEELGIDRNRSLLVGDRLSDVIAGFSSGIPNVYHVQTGHGARERSMVREWQRSQREYKNKTTRSKLHYVENIAAVGSAILDVKALE